MSWADEYTSERAFWVALRTRAARQAHTERTQPSHELLRQFVIQRFMTRLFTPSHTSWVVAGGIGMLIRVPRARATRDLDLTTTDPHSGDRRQVLDDLAPHTGLSELDPFAFTINADEPFTGVMRGTKLRVTATIGAEQAAIFGLDVAADALRVSDIEHSRPEPVVPGIRGLSPIPAIPLFPLASQIADKIIGVAFRDDQGRSANRYRDLVDLALYAGDVDVDADQLRDALRARAAARGQPLPTHLDVPDAWETPYRRVASKTTLQPALHNATTAAEAVGAWLNPVLAGEIQAGCVWDHRSGVWRHTSEPVARPGRVWVRPHMRDGRPVTDYFRRRPRH
ncbi:nucleotidyl transferase AbiEii/AbiGii toxin family protein [Mycobacterium timonense]|uniref:Nucleotidyl transferase AbiEii/AbiGii toxin family protein n=3 Tax=Mycobacterium TaxID=1763 RepID=A0AAW5S4W8_MYCBC|nr:MULTISPECIES: nucleotidyl transferase AbiEii/AbiGii toxin family protein [Mycobacterium]KMV20727.1 hypothetical protein ACT16_20385 [Mycobacterium heckeshornense]MCV6989742.1 nucleotidyl transferase AbiEii/AbiGii toxin family protein [Mycobacterium bouchedurhonense]MCV6996682.1 nucleotidyl transferase AbiEii/AbiGii toxin family protein [Mycobacterium timonense]ORA43633.1 hypothetical protein BST19_22790 [Mycobacterium bouchedurhonense]ORB77121.1 hypothetical protein BST46_26310 [Mycobacteri